MTNLTYLNGSVCGEECGDNYNLTRTSLSIGIFCDKTMGLNEQSTSKSVSLDFKGVAAFQIVSSAGCPILVINEVWN